MIGWATRLDTRGRRIPSRTLHAVALRYEGNQAVFFDSGLIKTRVLTVGSIKEGILERIMTNPRRRDTEMVAQLSKYLIVYLVT